MLGVNLVIKEQFFKEIIGKRPFYGHFPIMPFKNSMVKMVTTAF